MDVGMVVDVVVDIRGGVSNIEKGTSTSSKENNVQTTTATEDIGDKTGSKNDNAVQSNASTNQQPTLAENELFIFGDLSSESDSKRNELGNMLFICKI